MALLILEGVLIPWAVQLKFAANTKNITEYEALILGLRIALELWAKRLKLIDDSQLVLRQVLMKYRTLNPRLEMYKGIAHILLAPFQQVVYMHTLQSQSLLVYALTSLAYAIEFPTIIREETIMVQQSRTSVIDSIESWAMELMQKIQEAKIMKFEVCCNDEVEDDGNPRFYDIQNYIQHETFLEYATSRDKEVVRRMATRYFMRDGVLFMRSFSVVEL